MKGGKHRGNKKRDGSSESSLFITDLIFPALQTGMKDRVYSFLRGNSSCLSALNTLILLANFIEQAELGVIELSGEVDVDLVRVDKTS